MIVALLFLTVMPCRCTSSGSSGVAGDSLFCTCTCAMSGSASGPKVSVSSMLPVESDTDDM